MSAMATISLLTGIQRTADLITYCITTWMPINESSFVDTCSSNSTKSNFGTSNVYTTVVGGSVPTFANLILLSGNDAADYCQ